MKQKYYIVPLLLCLLAVTSTVIPATYAKYVKKEALEEKASIAGVSVKAESQSSNVPVYPGSDTMIGSVTIDYSGSETNLKYDVILEFEQELPQGTKVYFDGNEVHESEPKKYEVSPIYTETLQDDKITYAISIMLLENNMSVEESNGCSVVVNAEQAY